MALFFFFKLKAALIKKKVWNHTADIMFMAPLKALCPVRFVAADDITLEHPATVAQVSSVFFICFKAVFLNSLFTHP